MKKKQKQSTFLLRSREALDVDGYFGYMNVISERTTPDMESGPAVQLLKMVNHSLAAQCIAEQEGLRRCSYGFSEPELAVSSSVSRESNEFINREVEGESGKRHNSMP